MIMYTCGCFAFCADLCLPLVFSHLSVIAVLDRCLRLCHVDFVPNMCQSIQTSSVGVLLLFEVLLFV